MKKFKLKLTDSEMHWLSNWCQMHEHTRINNDATRTVIAVILELYMKLQPKTLFYKDHHRLTLNYSSACALFCLLNYYNTSDPYGLYIKNNLLAEIGPKL